MSKKHYKGMLFIEPKERIIFIDKILMEIGVIKMD